MASPASAQAAARHQENATAHAAALGFLQALGLDLAADADPHELWSDCWALGHVAAAVQAARRNQALPPGPHAPPPPGSSRRFREVVEDFTAFSQVCRDLGVPPGLLPPLADVEQGHGGPALCACLEALAGKAAAAGLAQLPRWGGEGARGRSSLRASMSRENSAKRAELFSARGSPPKLPALDKSMTPRAFAGRATTPTAGAALLRAAISRLRGGSQQAEAPSAVVGGEQGREQQEQEQQAPAPEGSLHSTVAALERAAAEAAEAARQLQAVPQRRAVPRRPALPPLNVAAAAALAAAEAAEEYEDSEDGEGSEEGQQAAEWADAAAASSPLDSPHSSDSYCTSRSTAVSAASSPCSDASPSPSRHKLTPNRLAQAATCNPLWAQSPQLKAATSNPLWAQSPQSQAPTPKLIRSVPGGAPAAAAAAATLRLDSESPPERQQQRQPPEEEEEDEDEEQAAAAEQAERAAAAERAERAAAAERAKAEARAEAAQLRGSDVGGSDVGGSDLLESLLCPPRLKPAHTQLLGALMHTYTPPTEDWTELRQHQHQRQRQAEEPRAAAKPSATRRSSKQGAGGAGKFGTLLLGVAAGATAALAAGLLHQSGGPGSGQGARHRSRRPQKGAQLSPRRRHVNRRGVEREERCEAAAAAPQWAAITQG